MPKYNSHEFQDKKYFTNYYFKIKADNKETTIIRQTKESALKAYYHYLSLGNEVEWHGEWNGILPSDNENIE